MRPESDFVFNIVWTGSIFPYLRYFVGSQLRHSDARSGSSPTAAHPTRCG
jgi:hypothetical protein